MRIEPASFDQLRRAADGRIVLIGAEESTVAADLQRIDPCLRLRWAENGDPPFFAVYSVPEGGCPCPSPTCEHGHLVLTAAECDDRIVKRIQQIDPHGRGGYHYADALERSARDAHRAKRAGFLERMSETAEQTAHALRKDLGLGPYRGQVFISNKPKGMS